MYQGGNDIILPVILLAILAIVVLFGAYYARRAGHLRSRGAVIGASFVVVLLAILLWLGPGFLMAAR